MSQRIEFDLNGSPVEVKSAPERKLLWVLRSDLSLTGSKYGCGIGQCGACTVVVDGRAVRSCLATIGSVAGKKVVTIEGLEKEGRLHPVQKAFIEHDALQCGICIPGMIMNAYAFLEKNPSPRPEKIRSAMEGNLCRCGTYKRVVAALESAAEKMRGS